MRESTGGREAKTFATHLTCPAHSLPFTYMHPYEAQSAQHGGGGPMPKKVTPQVALVLLKLTQARMGPKDTEGIVRAEKMGPTLKVLVLS